jgi:hypothetical protein
MCTVQLWLTYFVCSEDNLRTGLFTLKSIAKKILEWKIIIYLLQLGCHPVAVAILHVYKM